MVYIVQAIDIETNNNKICLMAISTSINLSSFIIISNIPVINKCYIFSIGY